MICMVGLSRYKSCNWKFWLVKIMISNNFQVINSEKKKKREMENTCVSQIQLLCCIKLRGGYLIGSQSELKMEQRCWQQPRRMFHLLLDTITSRSEHHVLCTTTTTQALGWCWVIHGPALWQKFLVHSLTLCQQNTGDRFFYSQVLSCTDFFFRYQYFTV